MRRFSKSEVMAAAKAWAAKQPHIPNDGTKVIEMSNPNEVPWRIFLNGKYTYVIYAADGEAAIRVVNEMLGNIKAADTTIKAYRALSASD